jgi:BMFP domain-containing protein YqiC
MPKRIAATAAKCRPVAENKARADRPPCFARLGGTAGSRLRDHQEWFMLNTKAFDEIAARIGKAIENSPAKDIEKNVKAMLASSFARLDLVPRAEFDVQAQVLLKTREKLEALEKRLAELEARFPPTAA